MFHHPAWAVGSYRSGPPAGGTPQSKSTQPSRKPDAPDCTIFENSNYTHFSNTKVLSRYWTTLQEAPRQAMTVTVHRKSGNSDWFLHIGLKARIGFSRSVYGKPSIPQDSTHSPLSHYIPCISRLQRPHLTFRHLSLV